MPTTPAQDAKGFAEDRPWRDSERSLVRVLRALTDAGEAVDVTLSHVPFSGLGGPPGVEGSLDRSWEVLWSLATFVNVTHNGQPTTAPSGELLYALAGHPATALDEAAAEIGADGVAWTTEDDALLAQWDGWSNALRDLAARCSHMQPSAMAGVQVSVNRDDTWTTGWSWRVEIGVDDSSWPASSWEGEDLPEVAGAVLAHEYRWRLSLPAGHLLEDAIREESDAETRL